MKVAVIANNEQWEEINLGSKEVNFLRIVPADKIPSGTEAIMVLLDDISLDWDDKGVPILVNSVNITLGQMRSTANVVRLNGWPGFLRRNKWEVCGDIRPAIQKIFSALHKEIIQVKDEPGFISARVIAMVINEAYFTLGDRISTKHEIDIAMKLGTNYPYGPFEWALLIGVKRVCQLLEVLSNSDKRYLPAPLLQLEASQ